MMLCSACILGILALFQPVLSELDLTSVTPNVHERCLREAGIKKQDFTRYLEAPSFHNLLEENRACYVLCVGKEKKMVNDDGSINLEIVLKSIGDDPHAPKYRSILAECAQKREKNPCETLKNNLLCVITAVQKLNNVNGKTF